MNTTDRWSEHQRRLLEEMGIRLWAPPSSTDAAPSPGRPQAGQAAPAQTAPPAATGRPATPATPASPAARAAPVPPAAPMLRPSPTPDAAAIATGPRPEGVAQMDWAALRVAVAGCRACGLCQSRRNTVFGVGNAAAHWMLVGEAPGEQEDAQGEPFVGKAGQLLDRMLDAVGLTRAEAPPEQQVFIANVLKCRPPGNRNPQPQEVAQCEPFLLRQVELVRPRLVLAMGRFAVQSLLRSDEPIGRLRGRVHQYHGVPLVVTYHPAYLLRNPTDKARTWEDLCLAREVLAGTAAQ